MKKIIIVAVLILGLSSISAKEEKTNVNDSTANKKTTIMSEKETAKPIYLTKADFLEKVMNYEENPTEWKYLGDKPCIIDFYADWCGPCKMIAPILDELATEYAGEIYIYKINTEQEQELAGAFGIRSIPSLLFVPMEGQPQMAQGALPKPNLKEAIDTILLNKKSDKK